MRSPRLLAALGLASALVLSGCGGGEKTGTFESLKPTAINTCGVIGCPKATPTAKKPTSGPRAPTSKPTVKPAAPPPTKRPVVTQPPPKPFHIYIYGDKSGKNLIDPPAAAVYTGTPVVWHNADTKPHGVQAQNGAFSSGNIAPGKTYTWTAGAPALYNYQDSTRPYVNASIQVSAR